MMPELPIDDALPAVLNAVKTHRRAVLQAPPGAGKTTRVPLALLQSNLVSGRIVMLEPRRLAARAAAERMASTLGEKPGITVGYRMRGANKVSDKTRIEVVTEGVLTRMLQSDPELPGVDAVIFDEIHERSLNADLGLALSLEVADALRDDLVLIAMSATLDAAPIAQVMQAPIISSEGRSFPVDIRWLDASLGPKARRDHSAVDLVLRAVEDTEKTGGGVLVFLPGEAEIRRVAMLLDGRLPKDCVVRPLFGAMPFEDQQAAITQVTTGRKIVLATSIAETSLTLPDIRVVVDAGQARRARFDPSSGMSRLVTERATRAEADQRAGRAGRVSAGVCYRLWTKGEHGALSAFPPAEIEAADLTSLALELAHWGASADDLPFLTPPPGPALAEAQALLSLLGALDSRGRPTPHGTALARLPLHPRLGHVLLCGGAAAAPLAALLADRDPLRGAPSDLTLRLDLLKNEHSFRRNRPYDVLSPVVQRIKAEVPRLRRDAVVDKTTDLSPGALAALAYPDRIGLRRKGEDPRFLLSGGKGAYLAPGDDLATAPLLVAVDLYGNPREAKIRMAARVSESELRTLFADAIEMHPICAWSKRDNRVVARLQERLGAIALSDRAWKDVPDDVVAAAMMDGVRQLGLRLSPGAQRLTQRVELARARGTDLPDMSEARLLETLEHWLQPVIGAVSTAEGWKSFDAHPALTAMLTWEQQQALDRVAPSTFVTPLGRKLTIAYTETGPEISVRLQEMFGTTVHPTAAGQPLKVTLLSPAQRPIQVTMDLPGFWSGSYADVRKDMRAQYPKHPWPEDPTQADPTLRAKPRRG